LAFYDGLIGLPGLGMAWTGIPQKVKWMGLDWVDILAL